MSTRPTPVNFCQINCFGAATGQNHKLLPIAEVRYSIPQARKTQQSHYIRPVVYLRGRKRILKIQGKDLTGAPVEKSVKQESRTAHLSGLVFPPNY